MVLASDRGEGIVFVYHPIGLIAIMKNLATIKCVLVYIMYFLLETFLHICNQHNRMTNIIFVIANQARDT
jgi:hypothetical protein